MQQRSGIKSLSLLWRFLTEACVFCVISCFLLFFLSKLTVQEAVQPSLPLSQFALVFLFSVILSAADRLFSLPIPLPLALILHYCVTCGGFFGVFSAAKKLAFSTFGALFVAIILFTLFYALIAGGILLFRHLTRSPQSKQQEYESRF